MELSLIRLYGLDKPLNSHKFTFMHIKYDSSEHKPSKLFKMCKIGYAVEFKKAAKNILAGPKGTQNTVCKVKF